MNEQRIIFKCRVGSHLYGLNRPDSDIDYFSVFMPTAEDLLGLQKCEIVNNSTKSSKEDRRNNEDDIDDVSYSLPKYMSLVLANNPNIVETLFATSDNILTLEPEFKFLMDNHDKIISQRVLHTFSGYAMAQKKKLVVKKERYGSLSDALELIQSWASVEVNSKGFFNDKFYSRSEEFLEWINEEPQRFWRDITEEESELLNARLKYYKGDKHNCESFHKGMDIGMIYRKVRKEYEKYGWRVKTDSFEKLGFDLKFAYHLIRLEAEGIELLTTGKLVFPISGKAREDILKVRNGEIQYDQLLEMYEQYEAQLQAVAPESKLPHSPNFKWANKWLIQTLKEAIIKEVP